MSEEKKTPEEVKASDVQEMMDILDARLGEDAHGQFLFFLVQMLFEGMEQIRYTLNNYGDPEAREIITKVLDELKIPTSRGAA